MYRGDRTRKETLVEYGFRLPVGARQPAAAVRRVGGARCAQAVFVSATPARLRAQEVGRRGRRAGHPADRPGRSRDRGAPGRHAGRRPAGRDPQAGRARRARAGHHADQALAEDLTDYLQEHGVRVRYLHSDIDTFERVEILREPAPGRVRRPGRHQPAARGARPARGLAGRILDADKEGFLRSERSLIQTIGRAARHVNGEVILYADKMTDSMQARSTRPIAAARSSSPTTRSTASPRNRSSRRSTPRWSRCIRPSGPWCRRSTTRRPIRN